MSAPIAVDPPNVLKAQAARTQRRWQYLAIMMEEAGIDPKTIPSGNVLAAIISPYEQRGYTSQDVETWINDCDPAFDADGHPVLTSTGHEVDCFRARAKAALAPRPALGLHVAVIAGIAFLGAFWAFRERR